MVRGRSDFPGRVRKDVPLFISAGLVIIHKSCLILSFGCEKLSDKKSGRPGNEA